MCGRFANGLPRDQYRAAVADQLPDRAEPRPSPDADDYQPSYNVAPQTRSPVIRRRSTGGGEEGVEEIIIQTMKWGLIPRFTKHPPSYQDTYRTINARDDTLLGPTKSIWHPLLPNQRCVIFCQGFYEWQKKPLLGGSAQLSKEGGIGSEKVEKVPHFVGMKEPGPGRKGKDGQQKRLMAMAGLWEKVKFQGSKDWLYTFTVITTDSNPQLRFLHDRMPVILPDAASIATWLGLGEKEANSWSPKVASLLRPLDRELECYKVPKEVGKVGNSSPSYMLPVEDRKDGLKAFFGKQSKVKEEARMQEIKKKDGDAQGMKGDPGKEELKCEDASTWSSDRKLFADKVKVEGKEEQGGDDEKGGEKEEENSDAVKVVGAPGDGKTSEIKGKVGEASSRSQEALDQEEADRRFAEMLQREEEEEAAKELGEISAPLRGEEGISRKKRERQLLSPLPGFSERELEESCSQPTRQRQPSSDTAPGDLSQACDSGKQEAKEFPSSSLASSFESPSPRSPFSSPQRKKARANSGAADDSPRRTSRAGGVKGGNADIRSFFGRR